MRRALVVDDHSQLRTLLTRFLQSMDWHVWEASGAAQAVEAAVVWRMDLLVTDISLPGGRTGVWLAERVRAIHPGVRVLYVSGHEPGEVGRLALGDPPLPTLIEGRDAYLRKPFGLAEFREAVDGLVHTTN